MARGSQHQIDEVTWQTTGVRLGVRGLDLRSPADPGALVELLNARFRDDRTIQPRNGHTGAIVRDGSDLSPVGTGVEVTDEWVYGHGMRLSPSNAAAWENAHHPFAGRGGQTFRFADTDVVWTGDRLLVVDPKDGPGIGASTFWHRSTPNTTLLERGIPAYLPLQTDLSPPATVTGNYVETCLTDRYRVFVHTETGGLLYAWLVDRDTGAVVDRTEISGASNDPVEPRVFPSAGYIVVLWRDATSKVLYRRYWSGTQWAAESVVHADVYAYDVVPVPGGFHLLWREGAPSSAGLFIGKYSGVTSQSLPYTFRTAISTNQTPSGPVALGVSPNGNIGVLYDGTGLHARVFTPAMTTIAGTSWLTLSGSSSWNGGVSICSRGLRDSYGSHEWVVHASRSDTDGVLIRSFTTVRSHPATAAAMQAAAGGYGTWSAGYLLDEASGSIAPAFGSPSLIPAGTPTYSEPGAFGNSDKSIKFDSGADNFSASSSSFDVGAAEDLGVAWVWKLSTLTGGQQARLVVKSDFAGGPYYAVYATATGMSCAVGDGVDQLGADPGGALFDEWVAGMFVLERATNKIRAVIKGLESGTIYLSAEVDASAVGSLSNAQGFFVGSIADQPWWLSALYIAKGVGACTGMSANLETAVTTFANGVGSFVADTAGTVRYNSRLASKSFRVGDEVFCWLRSRNAGTHYLVGGVYNPQVSGFADREEAVARVTADGNYGIPAVASDPLDETGTRFTWIRPYNTGQSYARPGNVRAGDMDFLPPMTAVAYGQCTYLSGSNVRAYDGVELGDAGFQDYPVIATGAYVASGGSLGTGNYYFRVYPVRYNKRGERFQGAAVTYGPINLPSGTTNQILLGIQTLPCTNHSDVQFEVYRTEANGTAFYLDGVIANTLTNYMVNYTSTRKDRSTPLAPTDLIKQEGDSHAAGVGQLSELEEWGPLGCSMLAVSGDRLWGAGGQVPAGTVQFSKLHEAGEGAGFDSLAGFQVVDTEGNAVTSVARLNDVTVVLEADRSYVIAGIGPDNYGRGAFQGIITLAGGATSHRGTVLTPLGLVFWGASGPRILTTNLEMRDISQPVHQLSSTLEPTGVRADLKRHEVVWYTATGDALLWNYLADQPRWARWSGLHIAGCSPKALITVNGKLLTESDVDADDGQAITFTWRTGNLRLEQILLGATLLGRVGVVGEYFGEHRLRFRIYYNGSLLWADQWVWEPEVKTWLETVLDNANLTPAGVDALAATDHSGAYRTHKRASRHECSYFSVEVSNIEAVNPTYIPTELSLELGSRGGLSRVPVNTYSNS